MPKEPRESAKARSCVLYERAERELSGVFVKCRMYNDHGCDVVSLPIPLVYDNSTWVLEHLEELARVVPIPEELVEAIERCASALARNVAKFKRAGH